MPRLWGSVDFPDLITLYTSLPSSEKSWASKSMLFPLRTAEQPTGDKSTENSENVEDVDFEEVKE